MKEIAVLLLGPPEVRFREQPVSIQRRVTRALLFYLASQEGPVGREELFSILWDEIDEQSARRRLRETLSKLRSAIPESDWLIGDQDLVGVNPELVYVDQVEFQDLIDQVGRVPWQIPANTPLPEPIYKTLDRAAALWRGPRFLAGVDLPSTHGLDDWLMRSRQRTEHLRERVLQRLAEHAYATGDLEMTVQYARLALMNDEINEELHYQLLRALVEMGRRSEAHEYFAYVQMVLRRELDTTPGPRLLDLYRQIRQETGPTLTADPRPEWRVHPSVQVPFVGRQLFIDQISRAYSRGGGVFIFGESGLGKTRLIQETAARISPPPRLLLTVCRSTENNLPFQPIIELLRYQILPDEWLALSSTWSSQLTLLLPELTEMRPDLERPQVEFAPEAPRGQALSLLLEAIRQIFLLIARERRLMLCLDDLHWADEATIGLIAYLLSRPPFNNGKALLVGAARQEVQNKHLEAMRASLEPSSGVMMMSIQLSQLNLDEINALARTILSAEPPPEFTERLAGDTGGNTLFVLETLRAYLDVAPKEGQMFSGPLPLAGSVGRLIRNRLQKLSPRSYAILEIIAIFGAAFDPDTIASISPYTAQELVQALEDLEREHLIESRSRSENDVRLRFIHNIIREVLLQDIHPVRARWLHGQIARVLEKRLQQGDSSQAAVLAEHLEFAGDEARAFDYWLMAGQRSRQLYAADAAAQAFQRANRLVERVEGLSDSQIHRLYSEWVELAYENDEPETIRQISQRLLETGQARGSALLLGAGFNRMSDASMAENRFDEGIEYTNQALSYLENSKNLFELMEAYNRRGVFLYMLQRVDDAMEAFQDALALGDEPDDLQVMRARANAHYQLAVTFIFRGDPKIGLQHAIRSLVDFNHIHRFYGQAMAYSAMALAHYFLGDFRKADEVCQQGIEICRRIHGWRVLGYLYDYQAMIDLVLGKLQPTVAAARQGLEIGEQYGHHEIAAGAHRMLGDLYYWLGDYPSALEYYQQALSASHDLFLVSDYAFRLGLVQYLLGYEGGKILLDDTLTRTEESGMGMVHILASLALVTLQIKDGKLEQAAKILEEVAGQAQKRGMQAIYLRALCHQGEVAFQQGDLDRAIEIFKDCVRESSELNYPLYELISIQLLVQASKQANRPTTGYVERAGFLLEQLATGLVDDTLLAAFTRYRRSIESKIGRPTSAS